MITLDQYFHDPHTGSAKPHTDEHARAAVDLLARVAALWTRYCEESGRGSDDPLVCPNTGSAISGSKGGDGDGGFRSATSKTGAKGSAHRAAKAVDVYDPRNELDDWLDLFEDGAGGNPVLAEFGLYREHPAATPTWCHLGTRPTASGARTFRP